jgi:DNA-binding response OmpR family regulator
MPDAEVTAATGGQPASHALNVLVTSPDSTLARLVAWNLEHWGFHLCADTGTAGGDPPPASLGLDLIIADLDAGETLCWDEAYRLRARYPGTALLLLSHEWPRHDPLAALQPCGYVRKPFAVGDLLATIRQLAPSD